MKPRKTIIAYDTSRLGELHCDASGCGFVMPEASPWGADLIGTPCPRCGANLLTPADYNRVERMLRFIDFINRIFGPWFGRTDDRPQPGDRTMSVRMHGDQIDISILPIGKDEGR